MKKQRFNRIRRKPAVRAAAALAAAFAALTGETRSAKGVISTDPSITQGFRLNDLIGATSVYNNYNNFGQDSTIAVIDLGLIDNTHPALNQVSTFIYTGPSNSTGTSTVASSAPQNLLGWHATAVGLVAAGHDAGALTYLNAGIAPYATLWSGSIVASGDPNSSYGITTDSLAAPFVTAMQTGINGAKADVVNVSFGDPNGNGYDYTSVLIDSLVAQTHIPVVIAAGNSGPAAGTVGSPAVGFNGISVAALQLDQANLYTQAPVFSSRGPSVLLNPYTGATLSVSRAAIDISAPGTFVVTADSPVLDPSNASFPYVVASGTSFSAPIVTGVVAQLTTFGNYLGQFGYPTADMNNALTIKANLLNSADKVVGWDNGQHNVNGVVVTTQGLDYTLGAGRVNAARAVDNFLGGNIDPKVVGAAFVNSKGWDLSNVSATTPNDYIAAFSAGDTLTATLDWYVNRTFPTNLDSLSLSEGAFVNLDLKVFEETSNGLQLVAESIAPDNNVQQLSFAIPTTGYYDIQVDFAGVLYPDATGVTPTNADYALAWSNDQVWIPEPAIMGTLIPFGFLLRRQRKAKRDPA